MKVAVDLTATEVEIEDTQGRTSVRFTGAGRYELGPWVVEVDGDPVEPGITWAVANRGDAAASLFAVRIRWNLSATLPLRIYSHGYQSWSPCWVRTLGVDRDPSQAPGSLGTLRGWHHADQRVVDGDELRSELVTVLQGSGAGAGPCVLAGFLGATEHDGTFRVRDAEAPALDAEAWLGGALIEPGERRVLHPVAFVEGDDASSLLASWAAEFGARQRARRGAEYQVGWCSWYHYFHDVSERALDANLARADRWPFDVFQLDDGYQAAIGDWFETNDDFPSELPVLADRIAARGRRPGLWLAPFMATPDAAVAAAHPDWIARHESGRPLIVHLNPGWGGETWSLDTTRTDVLAHIEDTARGLVSAGFTYLKLDFTYCPTIDGRWHDPGPTPAQRVRAGFEAFRRGAGPNVFLLGCGAPLGQAVGVFDGMRIGPDVAPSWDLEGPEVAGIGAAQPATVNAWRNTLSRSFMHRRLWLNDPDCLMLRRSETHLSDAAVEAWADAVAASGGMALVSDDLALLDREAARLLDRVVTTGREVDAAARSGEPPRCPDLMEHPLPGRLEGTSWVLDADPSVPTAALSRRGFRTG